MSKTIPDDDHGLDVLLDLDGVSFFIDPDESYRVKFEVKRVPVTEERPHGLRYAITLHDPAGNRIFGYDNAHPTRSTDGPSGRKNRSQDHVHRGDSIRPYAFRDAVSLLDDFWNNVDKILESKGAKK